MKSGVSVIIPTYNYAHYITEAINSVLQQTYPPEQIEIIVVDDGSTDNTAEVLQPYVDDGRIKYYYQQNKGKANATARGIKKSSGKYIFNLDADDYFLADKVAASVAVFEENETIVHVSSPAKFVFQDKEDTGYEKLPSDIIGKPLDGNWLLHRFYNNNILFGGGSTYAARASVLKSVVIPDGVDMYIDEFLLLAVLPFGKSYFAERPLSVWRVHNFNYSNSNVTKEKQAAKVKRLEHSSASVLAYLQNNQFNKEVLNIYRLQHATRSIAFKEALGTKRTGDIFKYGAKVFFDIKPSLKHLAKYNVLNRLIPTKLFHAMKRIKAGLGNGNDTTVK